VRANPPGRAELPGALATGRVKPRWPKLVGAGRAVVRAAGVNVLCLNGAASLEKETPSAAIVPAATKSVAAPRPTRQYAFDC
jgi:hypothetical protein